ncbi:hypothetical protein PSPO01_06580 [Paraphaeosphaeria sporulosa]
MAEMRCKRNLGMDVVGAVKTGRCLDVLVRMIRRVGGEDAGEDMEVASDRVCLMEKKTSAPVWGELCFILNPQGHVQGSLDSHGRAGYPSRKRKRQSNQKAGGSNGAAGSRAPCFPAPPSVAHEAERDGLPQTDQAKPTPRPPPPVPAVLGRLSGFFPPPISGWLDGVDARTRPGRARATARQEATNAEGSASHPRIESGLGVTCTQRNLTALSKYHAMQEDALPHARQRPRHMVESGKVAPCRAHVRPVTHWATSQTLSATAGWLSVLPPTASSQIFCEAACQTNFCKTVNRDRKSEEPSLAASVAAQ